MSPHLLVFIDCSCRHDQMDVWVILQTSIVGMQNRVCTHLTVEIGVTSANGLHSQPSRSQQKVIRCSLMLPEPGPEFIRHCEGQQKIGDWQELGCLPLDPLLAFNMLAVRAAAMPTGMWNLDRVLAVPTLHHHQIAALLTATGHCRLFPEGADVHKRPYEQLRWSRFKHLAPGEMFALVGESVFPFLRTLGSDGSAYASHMKDARFTIPKPELLAKVVDLLDAVPMADRDTKGDIYEYMLGKLATAGTNGQFRTPRHIIELMVAMTEPVATEVMADPACGTCGLPVAVGEYLRKHNPEIFSDPQLREHFNHGLFHGFDFDNTMLRIGAMNMLLHGVENPDVSYRDSLSEDGATEENKYTLILANPPSAGSLDYESTSSKLQRVVKTKKTELLFMALFLQLLKPGGRAAVIVPDGVLFGASKAHKELRRTLVEDHFLEGVVSLPSGVFRPYAGVSTAILLFTKTGRGGTDQVWFYDMTADGWSLDDKRNPLLPLEKLGPAPKEALAEGEHEKNNLPDCLARWRQRKDSERERERTAQSFCVPKAEIAEQGYDLSLNRYKELVHEEVEHRPPLEILAELRAIEQEILQGIEELEGMLR